MTDAPVSNVPPCAGRFQGRLLSDWCDDCHHMLSVHRQDRVCALCDSTAVLRAELLERIERIERKLDTEV
jgi:Zn finger protein HypA/HybF involved in hydrogenase expression